MKKVDETKSGYKMEDLFPNTVQCIRESRFNEAVIPLLRGKLAYPYNLAQTIDDFEKIDKFPSREDFYDTLTEKEISEEDYLLAKEIYEVSNCRNLKDFHDIYLMLDTTYLADTWRDFSEKIHADFGVYASNCTTGPSLFYSVAMRKSQTRIKLLDDLSIYEKFIHGVKGGLTVVNKRYAAANCVEMKEKFDPTKPSSSLLFGDFNALYGGTLRCPMPYGNMKYLDDSSVMKYNTNPKLFLDLDTSDSATKGYFITLDFTIPDDLKKISDDLPLGLVNSNDIYASKHTRD